MTPTEQTAAEIIALCERRSTVDELRKQFESLNRDSYNFRRSRRGTYVNPAIARDWKWFILGVEAYKGLS